MLVHDSLITAFIIIACVALLAEAVILLAVALMIRKAKNKLMARVEPILDSAREIMTETRQPIRTALANLTETSQTIRNRAHSIDESIDEVLGQMRLQMFRFDQAMNDMILRLQNAGNSMQRSVVAPIHEATAVLKGFRAGMDFLISSKRRDAEAAEAVQDEQMFI